MEMFLTQEIFMPYLKKKQHSTLNIIGLIHIKIKKSGRMLEFPLGILFSDESEDLEHGRYSVKIYWMNDAKHHYHNL